MAVPDTHDFADGVLTSSELNIYVRDPVRFLLRPPMAELRQIVAQTLTTSVAAALTFTASDVDQDYLIPPGSGHSNSVNTSRYVANFAGWYQISGQVSYVANAAGRRAAIWVVNGVSVSSGQLAGPPTAALACEIPARTKFIYLSVGDFVELFAYQESGGNLATDVAFSNVVSGMSIKWVSN